MERRLSTRLSRSRSYTLEKQQPKPLNESFSDVQSDIDETFVKGAIERSVSNCDTSAAVDSLLDDNAPIPNNDMLDRIEQAFEKMSATDESSTITMHSKPEEPLTLNIDPNLNTFADQNLSPSFSLHTSPSLDALNDSRNQSLYFTPSSGRDFSSPTPSDQFLPGRLIRSNSYVLEKPSPLLLKHMEENGINTASTKSRLNSPKSLNELRSRHSISHIPRKSLGSNDALHVKEQKMKISTPKSSKSADISASSFGNNSLNATVVKLNTSSAAKTTKTTSLSARPKQSNHKTPPNQLNQSNQSNHSGVFKNTESVLRSIYGSTKPKQPASIKRMNTSITLQDVKKPSPKANYSMEVVSSRSSNSNISSTNYQNIFEMIEQKHTAQMGALMKQQQEEQKRMQEHFLQQQEELLKRISNLLANKNQISSTTPNSQSSQSTLNSTINVQTAKKSNEKMLIEEVNNEVPVTVDTNGNRVNKFTPDSAKCIRRLYYEDNRLASDELNKSYPSSFSTGSSEPFEMYTIEEVKAATTIAAYMRGYLTRRLFRTMRVQNIVKTIRDTLLFVLDMHYEDNQNESAADIELKSHLIQQVGRVV